MSAVFLSRVLAVAAVAVLGGVAALAVAERGGGSEEAVQTLPEAVGWRPALAGVRAKPPPDRRSRCGYVVQRSTLGVGHPVLPCGAKIYLEFGGKRVLTQVVDRGPAAPGHAFELTPGLARLVGLRGVQTVRWAFARS